MKIYNLFYTLLVFVLMFVQCPFPVFANGMSYYMNLDSPTGNIMPLEEMRVSIVKEDLNLKVIRVKKDFFSNPGMYVDVRAVYLLKNHTDESIRLPVAFPQQGGRDDVTNWTVQLDQKTISLLDSGLPLDEKLVEDGVNRNQWVNPWTGKEYWFRYSSQSPETIAQTFSIELAPGEHQLTVSYRVRTGIDESKSLNPIYQFTYLLLPAKYWKDFQDLTITLEIPFGHRLHSSLPLQQINQTIWKGHFDKLPEQNLHLFFSPMDGTWGGLVTTRSAALLLLSVAIIFHMMIKRISQRFHKKSLMIQTISALMISLIVLVTFSRKIFTYPFDIFQPPLFWILNIWLIVPLVKKWMVIARKTS